MAITTYLTPFGKVFRSDKCKDDFKNIVEWKDIKLQRPAMYSLRAAMLVGGRFRLTGSLRTCAQQRALWKSDNDRFAHPSVGVHTQGLAIDVHMADLNKRVKLTLLALGWKQSRPDDEPWHFSFKVKA